MQSYARRAMDAIRAREEEKNIFCGTILSRAEMYHLFQHCLQKHPQKTQLKIKRPTPKTKPGKNWKKNEGYVIWTKNFYVMLDIYTVFSTVRD